MKRSSCSYLWRLWVLLAGLAATSTTWADALSAVEVLREGGCGGTMPAAPPLRHNPMLDRAAAAWAMGQSLPVASERNGYRGDFTAGMHISGPDSATLELLRRSGCRIVAGRGMRDIGEYRRGFDTWLVVGSFYRLPPGLQASTGTWMAAPALSAMPAPAPGATRPSAPMSAPTPKASLPPVPAPTRATAAEPLLTAALSPAQATRALQLVNDVRARGVHCGDELFGPAPPVTLSGTLAGVALGHASDMAEKNYFEHVDPAGQSPADRVRAVGYSEKLVGENIAFGPKSVDEVVRGWLDSPGHCENIMDPRFAEMGLGLAAGRAKRGLYWVQVLAEPRA
ncbi:MAG: hypothetical protein JWL65_5451 [Gammaproteobacteria bacterium]|nr:hypothetical protein [Gammaproteobacteria bacterium]